MANSISDSEHLFYAKAKGPGLVNFDFVSLAYLEWSSGKSIRDHSTAKKKVELAILGLLASRKSRIFYLKVERVEKVESGRPALTTYEVVFKATKCI